MRLRTTIAASVLALGAVLGGAGSALAHDDCDHDNGRQHNYNRDNDYGRHKTSYGLDNDYGRRKTSYGRDNGKSHECHTAMGSSANHGAFYENDCKSDNDRGDRYHY